MEGEGQAATGEAMTDTELNEAVARKLEYQCIYYDPIEKRLRQGQFGLNVPDFCADIAAAWEMVEKYNGDVIVMRQQNKWVCDFIQDQRKEWADTAPRAICLAFLKLEEKPNG